METEPSVVSLRLPEPGPLGLKKSFGYGDRLGLATTGHLAAHRKFGFAPIFAQQSIREMTRTGRSPREVVSAAQEALLKAGFTDPWGADADHLKNLDEARETSEAGFCFFTVDPSDFVENRADKMSESELSEATGKLVEIGVFETADWREPYVGKSYEVSEDLTLSFTKEDVDRAAVKYARAIAHTATMEQGIREVRGEKPFEVEVSVDETTSPTTALEHLFFGLELKRRKVEVVSLAPRFVGVFEKGVDYQGDVALFERSLAEHVAIARFCGPYKISVHSGSDKLMIYPAIGRMCGDLLHVKTSGTSYLEALRCVARASPPLFRQIAEYCAGRFEEDRASYEISTSSEDVRGLFNGGMTDMEKTFLDERAGRQLLHVTFGSVLSQGRCVKGRTFRESILEILIQEEALHHELLERHFERHLHELSRG